MIQVVVAATSADLPSLISVAGAQEGRQLEPHPDSWCGRDALQRLAQQKRRRVYRDR